MKSVLRWAVMAVVLPLLAEWFALPPIHRIVAALTLREAVVGQAQTTLPGHGAYCREGDQSALFLGRDLGGLGSYSVFEVWCEEQGGEVGWTA